MAGLPLFAFHPRALLAASSLVEGVLNRTLAQRFTFLIFEPSEITEKVNFHCCTKLPDRKGIS